MKEVCGKPHMTAHTFTLQTATRARPVSSLLPAMWKGAVASSG